MTDRKGLEGGRCQGGREGGRVGGIERRQRHKGRDRNTNRDRESFRRRGYCNGRRRGGGECYWQSRLLREGEAHFMFFYLGLFFAEHQVILLVTNVYVLLYDLIKVDKVRLVFVG